MLRLAWVEQRGTHMTGLDDFKDGVSRCMGKQASLRPFVCEGSPLDCKAFIVGFNPATETDADFWGFWRAGTGFDKAAWLQHYKEQRQLRPLEPGKRRRRTVSPSRGVIEWILQDARPIPILETNIHAVATATQDELAEEDQRTDVFDFLMASIRPRLIVTHGNRARDHLWSKGYRDKVIDVPHFSRGWSESDARMLGRWIKQVCSGAS